VYREMGAKKLAMTLGLAHHIVVAPS